MVGERLPSVDMSWGRWTERDEDTGLAMNNQGWQPPTYPLDYASDKTTGKPCPSPALYGPSDLKNYCDWNHFGSLHPGGGNWLFADGSVRMIRYDARAIMGPLATPQGDETIDVTKYE
jgi:prepilin-type processing-associated H-X9-DG protein